MCKFTEIWGPVFKAFEERYPHVSSIIVDWYPCGQNEIIVKTNKGDKVIFNYIGETIRILERGTDTIDKDDITEEQWRKEFSARLCNKMAAAGIPRWELSRITVVLPQVRLIREDWLKRLVVQYKNLVILCYRKDFV